MNARLFVYGTLLSTACHPMGARLRREARLVGEASLPGQLYSLGRYPGLVEAPHIQSPTQNLVYGELYALATPAVTLRWLDAYEGIVPHKPDRSPYARVQRPVRLPSGGTVGAWVYVYLKSARGRPVVPGGRWLPPQV
ncbi:MAG TPA: gamma-glutamylcyclotransferase family protein [Hyphomicrobiaceae bacterium]|jgi:gamma-glutamylcyclotransferase (GGCT)/AIG2-like uncharacterized protein YtfP|nr:gamma-glutamylcyclotransferase family protein [Hyphomicrobiaceae bacterium]